jgi:hypothetical protein
MSKSAGKEVLDFPRLIRVLYLLSVPGGKFHPSKYNPQVVKQDPSKLLVSLEKGTAHSGADELSIEPVDPRCVLVGAECHAGDVVLF